MILHDIVGGTEYILYILQCHEHKFNSSLGSLYQHRMSECAVIKTYPKHLFLFLSEPYPKSSKEMLTCCPGDDLIIHEVFLSPHACLAPTLEMYPEVASRGIGCEHWILEVLVTEILTKSIWKCILGKTVYM